MDAVLFYDNGINVDNVDDVHNGLQRINEDYDSYGDDANEF